MSQQQLVRKRSSASRSNAQTDTVPRDQKYLAAKSPLYEKTLGKVGIYMDSDLSEPVSEDKAHCDALLVGAQPIPSDSLFHGNRFNYTCKRLRRRNEAMLLRDVTPVVTPSPELLFSYGAKNLEHLVEEINASWYKCLPLIAKGSNPQPDFFAGFQESAFSPTQLRKLEPFIGEFQLTHFMATEWVLFPFLTCEVKCGQEALNIADRQNAHSASTAVNGVVELYRAVSRQDEVDKRILAFSISHDERNVRIYGHYASIQEDKTTFHRHLVKAFDFTSENGKDRWTAYKFTRNVYDIFAPQHLQRIRAAVDQLPDPDAVTGLPLLQDSQAEQGDSQSTFPLSQIK